MLIFSFHIYLPRINKVLSMRTDSAAMIESFDAISSFYMSNTVEARRSLRQDVELQNINLAKTFLKEFENIHQQIETIENSSIILQEACEQLAVKVSTADENMKSFMNRASELDKTKAFYGRQSEEISKFLNRFQLTQEEIDSLYNASIDDPVGSSDFFNAFQRLKSAYNDCKVMVESNNYTAGFELLDALGQHQDTAYQRLFEWVKLKCESFVDDSQSVAQDIDIQLQFAIRNLRALPMYFSQCQDLVINSRRGQLVQKFVVALTQGGSVGQVFRAIDLHMHDPVRYIGDMLAWMHQTVVSEQEFLEAIFGDPNQPSAPRAAGSSSRVELDTIEYTSDGAGAEGSVKDDISPVGLSIQEMLVRCLQGLGRPLRVRVTQTLDSNTSLVNGGSGVSILYSLTDLLAFYEKTLSAILPLENAVHSAVKGSLLESKRSFQMLLSKQAELLVQSAPSTLLDLSPLMVTRDCCLQLREILKTHSTALSGIPSDSTDPCYIDTALGAIVQPLLQGCRIAGQTLGQVDMAVFILNNVAAIKTDLSDGMSHLYPGSVDRKNLTQWLELLDTEASAWVEVIVNEEAGKVFKRGDLDKLIELIDVLPPDVSASTQTGLGADRLATALRAFYESLNTSVLGMQMDRLIDTTQKELVRLRIATAIADGHNKVSKLVLDTRNGYDSYLLLHSDSEVRMILQIE